MGKFQTSAKPGADLHRMRRLEAEVANGKAREARLIAALHELTDRIERFEGALRLHELATESEPIKIPDSGILPRR